METRALLVAALLLLPLLPAASAEDRGTIGISPADVRVEDAQRGETYLRRVLVQNRFDTPTVVTIEPTGDVAKWLTTSPSGKFEVPPMTDAAIELRFAVPESATNGTHTGLLRVVADPKDSPAGSGLAFRYAAAVKLNVTLAGLVLERSRVAALRADDVEAGSAPTAFARLVNDGNVHTEATVRADILSADGRTVLASRTLAFPLLPGEDREFALGFENAVPIGTYLVRVVTADARGVVEETRPFKVVPPGTLGKKGALSELAHEPWADAGVPLRFTGRFQNSGNATIARAQLLGEVTRDGKLVGILESAAKLVPVGTAAELVAYFTPTEPGEYRVAARVVYDGFETPTEATLFTVEGEAAGGGPGLWLVGAGAAALGFLALVAWRRRKRDDEG